MAFAPAQFIRRFFDDAQAAIATAPARVQARAAKQKGYLWLSDPWLRRKYDAIARKRIKTLNPKELRQLGLYLKNSDNDSLLGVCLDAGLDPRTTDSSGRTLVDRTDDPDLLIKMNVLGSLTPREIEAASVRIAARYSCPIADLERFDAAVGLVPIKALRGFLSNAWCPSPERLPVFEWLLQRAIETPLSEKMKAAIAKGTLPADWSPAQYFWCSEAHDLDMPLLKHWSVPLVEVAMRHGYVLPGAENDPYRLGSVIASPYASERDHLLGFALGNPSEQADRAGNSRRQVLQSMKSFNGYYNRRMSPEERWDRLYGLEQESATKAIEFLKGCLGLHAQFRGQNAKISIRFGDVLQLINQNRMGAAIHVLEQAAQTGPLRVSQNSLPVEDAHLFPSLYQEAARLAVSDLPERATVFLDAMRPLVQRSNIRKLPEDVKSKAWSIASGALQGCLQVADGVQIDPSRHGPALLRLGEVVAEIDRRRGLPFGKSEIQTWENTANKVMRHVAAAYSEPGRPSWLSRVVEAGVTVIDPKQFLASHEKAALLLASVKNACQEVLNRESPMGNAYLNLSLLLREGIAFDRVMGMQDAEEAKKLVGALGMVGGEGLHEAIRTSFAELERAINTPNLEEHKKAVLHNMVRQVTVSNQAYGNLADRVIGEAVEPHFLADYGVSDLEILKVGAWSRVAVIDRTSGFASLADGFAARGVDFAQLWQAHDLDGYLLSQLSKIAWTFSAQMVPTIIDRLQELKAAGVPPMDPKRATAMFEATNHSGVNWTAFQNSLRAYLTAEVLNSIVADSDKACFDPAPPAATGLGVRRRGAL